jgi:hypothetical protein
VAAAPALVLEVDHTGVDRVPPKKFTAGVVPDATDVLLFLVVMTAVSFPGADVFFSPVTWMDTTVPLLTKAWVKVSLSVFVPVQPMAAPVLKVEGVTVPSAGVPLVPAGTNMITVLRVADAVVLNPKV